MNPNALRKLEKQSCKALFLLGKMVGDKGFEPLTSSM